MWQYCYKGKLPSITEDVDFSYSYKDYPTIIKSNGFNGFSLEGDEIDESETEETESFEYTSETETE